MNIDKLKAQARIGNRPAYVILSASFHEDLEESVCAAMSFGYQPVGGPYAWVESFDGDSYTSMCQAMIYVYGD